MTANPSMLVEWPMDLSLIHISVSFTGNRAEGGSGGALYSRGNVQVAAGSSFSGNAAAHKGGALCLRCV